MIKMWSKSWGFISKFYFWLAAIFTTAIWPGPASNKPTNRDYDQISTWFPILAEDGEWKSHQTMPKPHRNHKAPLESDHPPKSPSQLTASGSEKKTQRLFIIDEQKICICFQTDTEAQWERSGVLLEQPSRAFWTVWGARQRFHSNVSLIPESLTKCLESDQLILRKDSLGYLQWGKRYWVGLHSRVPSQKRLIGWI